MNPVGVDHSARREQLRAHLDGIDALLVTDPVNVRYLTGFTGSNAQVVVDRARHDVLLTDARYTGRAEMETSGLEIVVSRSALTGWLSEMKDGTVGVEADHLVWSAVRRLEDAVDGRIEPTHGLVERLRARKEPPEVERVAQACALTVEGIDWLATTQRLAGSSERALAIALERRFVDLGADAVAFPTILASGPNGAVPHHAPGDRVVEVGDVVTIDCGAVVDGYHADCTRNLAIGRAEPRLAEIHDVVAEAQLRAREAVRSGASGGAVDRAARRVIEAVELGERFVHPTGHGVGLEIHEAPTVAPESDATIETGAVLTVEPGIYLPGVGGVRIEDTLVVDPDGASRVLTDLSRELRVV